VKAFDTFGSMKPELTELFSNPFFWMLKMVIQLQLPELLQTVTDAHTEL